MTGSLLTNGILASIFSGTYEIESTDMTNQISKQISVVL